MKAEYLCLGCMTLKGISKKCPYCAFDEKKYKRSHLALPLRSVLKNRYLIGKILGSGGFGITYLAWDQTLEVAMAIKEYIPSTLAMRIREDYSVRPNSKDSEKPFNYYMSKFLEEARTLAKLNDEKGIVSVQDVFKEHGTIYIVMYYVSGVNLETYLKNAGGRLEADEGLKIMSIIMKSLSKVHKKGLIHRDISPDNIYITGDKQVKLLDFGAARYTLGEGEKTLSIILKRGYAPLEQYIEKGRQGPWTDVYSVGATLYKILTGKKPEDTLERMDQDSLRSPKAMGVKIDYKTDMAIMKALALKPENRFQSMEAFMQAIDPAFKEKLKAPNKFNNIKMILLVLMIIPLSFLQNASLESVNRSESYLVPEIDDSLLNNHVRNLEMSSVLLEDLTGQDYNDVLKKYKDFAIDIEISGYLNSDDHNENTILDQFPESGRELMSGDLVKVVLSKGPKIVRLPDFKSWTLDEVMNYVNENNLEIFVEYVYDETYLPGSLIEQRPEAWTEINDQSIYLKVSKDSDDLKSISYEKAKTSIKTSFTDKDTLFIDLMSYDLEKNSLEGEFVFSRPLTEKEKSSMRHSGVILNEKGEILDDLKTTFYADYEGNFLVNFLGPLQNASYTYILGIHIEELVYNLKLVFEVK